MNKLIIEPVYAGPVSYFAALCSVDEVVFDLHSFYEKHSYRNRCRILGANGVMNLSIPLQKGKEGKQILKDVKISYAEHWQKDHWISIVSSYRRAPFFEFYEDHFRPFYEKRFEFLCDFQLEYFKTMTGLMKTDISFSVTENYIAKGTFEGEDLRNQFKPNIQREVKPYLQVFADRTGFVPDLSVLDVLFNLGNQGGSYLRQI